MIDDFAHLARGFCDWCEGSEYASTQHGLAASWLCKLYGAALGFPLVDPYGWQGGPDIPPLQLAQAKANLSGFNGWYYREYWDPHPLLDDESCMGDVGDDMLDTYKDIKRGLLYFDQGQLDEATQHWAYLHRSHWGRHAVGAIFALHCMSLSGESAQEGTS
jgi:hypothetical protein